MYCSQFTLVHSIHNCVLSLHFFATKSNKQKLCLYFSLKAKKTNDVKIGGEGKCQAKPFSLHFSVLCVSVKAPDSYSETLILAHSCLLSSIYG